MPRDSLDLVEQHTALLNKREKDKKRTRLRNKVPDDWKSDKVYPQDKPASYTPWSPGRDVLSGGYRRSEYQIEVHSRDYAKRVVSRREKHGVNEGDRDITKARMESNIRGEGGEMPQPEHSSRRRKGHGRMDIKVEKTSESKILAETKTSSCEWSIAKGDEVTDLIVRFSTWKSNRRPSQHEN